MTNGTRNRFSPEVRARAARLVLEHKHKGGHSSEWAAMVPIAAKIGCTGKTFRHWVRQRHSVRQTEHDQGLRAGPTSEELGAGNGAKRPNAAGHLDGMDCVLSLMAFASGTVDIISFTSLGGIFASAMTGNLALLGLHAAQGNLHSAFASALSLAGFVLGAASATWFGYGKPVPRAVNRLLCAEVLLLAIFVLFWPLAGAGRGLLSYVPIIPIATAMGVQINIAKKLDLSGVSTTVFTSTLADALISLVQSACAGRLTFSTDTTRQFTALVIYLAGALLAGLAHFHHWFAVQMMPLVAILIAAVLHRCITRAAARQSR